MPYVRSPAWHVARADWSLTDIAPDLHVLNVIVSDVSASLDFYRQLPVVVPDGDVTRDAHVQLRMPNGFGLELDAAESVRL